MDRAAYARAYREAHREELIAYGRKYHAEHKARAAARYIENREAERARYDAWAKANKEKRAAYKRAYYLANRERMAETRRAYERANPDRVAAWKRNRADRKKANGGTYTPAEWQSLCDWFGNVCLCCGSDSLTVDHVIPSSKGGDSSIANLQPLCASCNTNKGVKTTDYRDPVRLAAFLDHPR